MKRTILLFFLITFVLLVVAIIVNPFLLMYPMLASGLYEGSRTKMPFDEAHQRAITTFVKSKGFGRSRIRKAGLWNANSVSYNSQTYYSNGIRLIGLTPEFGPRLFTENHPPKKEVISESDYRNLTQREREAAQILKEGKANHVELPPEPGDNAEGIRIIASIFTAKECLTCHDGEIGDVLGAFDYFLQRADWRPL